MTCTYLRHSLDQCAKTAAEGSQWCSEHHRIMQSTFWQGRQAERKTRKEANMSERTIVVKGVRLSKDEVEAAWKELNRPVFTMGQIVKDDTYVIVFCTVAGGPYSRGGVYELSRKSVVVVQ